METVPLPAFEDNYIWTLRRGGFAAVVDPGDAAPVLRHLAASGDRLCAILVTHHHADHTGGIAELLARQPVPVYGPARMAGALPLADGDRVELPELAVDFQVLHVPGHTRDHIAYYRRGMLFCGDTLFACGCGRLFEGTAAELSASLARFAALPGDTAVYCGHEYTLSGLRFARAIEADNPAVLARSRTAEDLRARDLPTLPTSIELELATNPFLRLAEPAVMA
ncbi:MAG TPA: hydroxyacylglutathione hydrolase, partial [Rhodocyclaceae bacterium]|nr:hydroxyacylglutathione hydrolase [Rhodocyclaceae bacterium]